VLGSPIAHSLSPALHTAAYAALGLADWRYQAVEVTEGGLADFLAGCDASWRGLSLTMPLKVAVLSLGEPDALAARVGAANTLLFGGDGSRRLHNTDVGGAEWALRRAGVVAADRATLLGAGATARSMLVALARLGVTAATVVARTPARAAALGPLAADLGITLAVRDWDAAPPPADVLVSTATAGAADSRAAALASGAATVFDVVYDPWPTPLAAVAGRLGRTVISGLDLLVGQALGQIELMTGRAVDPEVLLSAGRERLRSRVGQVAH